MSDKEIVREGQSISPSESHNKLLADVYKFGTDTIAHPDARIRQAFVATYGALVGGIKDLPNEFIHHPWQTIGKATASGASGIAIGAALASESPIIAGATTIASVVATAAALWNTYVRLTNNEVLQQSMDLAYKSNDRHSLAKSIQGVENVLGPEAANYGLVLATGLAGRYGPEVFSDLSWQSLTNKLRPLIPTAYGTENGAAEIKFADGSLLHMHGGQTIYQIGGWEYPLKSNPRGTNMSILGSIAGRQVINSWHDSPPGELPQPFAVDINPIFGITRVKELKGTVQYNHQNLAANSSSANRFLSCYECEPSKPNLK